jgi:hypothetical protein
LDSVNNSSLFNKQRKERLKIISILFFSSIVGYAIYVLVKAYIYKVPELPEWRLSGLGESCSQRCGGIQNCHSESTDGITQDNIQTVLSNVNGIYTHICASFPISTSKPRLRGPLESLESDVGNPSGSDCDGTLEWWRNESYAVVDLQLAHLSK